MTTRKQRQRQAKTLRIFRKVHRYTGALLFIFFLFISVTGILLGWKKNSNGWLLPDTHKGSSTELRHWLPIDSLHSIAINVFKDSVSQTLPADLDRIDIRKSKGSVKFIFEQQNWGIQLDGATGQVLNIGKRRSDFLENVHDGSVLDDFFKTDTNTFKLIYTSLLGSALFLFTTTGFWLWFGPKRLRKARREIS
ncbi:MAG: PepSY domain-containing protein [Bacteroidetes bacterium]|nr:MAG: PepSY domain-containing protein [Bacteroidota bacterium]